MSTVVETSIAPPPPTGNSPTPAAALTGVRGTCLAGLLVAGILFSDVVNRLVLISGGWLTGLAWVGVVTLTALAIWLRAVINCVAKTPIRRVGLLVGLCAIPLLDRIGPDEELTSDAPNRQMEALRLTTRVTSPDPAALADVLAVTHTPRVVS
jgi:hypothetical protein